MTDSAAGAMFGDRCSSRARGRAGRGLIIGALSLPLLLAACGGGSNTTTATTRAGGTGGKYTLVQAQSDLPVGTSRFVFGLVNGDNEPITGGAPQIWVANDQRSKPLGPFHSTWQTWSPSKGDDFGRAPIPGFFATEVSVPAAGTWRVLATDVVNGKRISAGGTIPVSERPIAAIGTAAISEPTPVATTSAEEAKIDTRQPPTPMHHISLDAALKNGRPTVLVFATPQFCQTRLCGPVVDEVLTLYERVGTAKANFVDVEIYPTHDTNKPTPEFLRWGFQTEPWVIVIDKTGIIRGRFEGPAVAPEIEAALNPLLAGP